MKTNDFQTYILLVKGNIGPGCLALPFCFSMLGPFASFSLTLFIGFFCVYNMWTIVRCKRKISDVKTYGELALATLGSWGESTVEFFLALMQLTDSLEPLIGIHRSYITLSLILPILFLTQLRHMAQLAPLSLIASTLICTALFLILLVSFHRIYNGASPDIPIFQSNKVISFFVSTIYAFEGIGIILPIEDAMENPHHFTTILITSMITVTIVYVTLAETIILTFGFVNDAGITGYLLREGSLTTQMAAIISCLISLAVFLSYPLQLYPALQVLEAYFGFGRDFHDHSNSSTTSLSNMIQSSTSNVPTSPEYTRHVSKRIFSSSSSIKSIEDALGEEQSPLVIFESNEQNNSIIELQKVKLIDSDFRFIDNTNHSHNIDNHNNHNNNINHNNHNNLHIFESRSTFYNQLKIPRDTIRISLVLITSLISALVPNVGLLVSLAGASSGAALSLIFPPIFDLVLHTSMKESRTYGELILDILSIVLGILASIFGTIQSLQDIWTTFSV